MGKYGKTAPFYVGRYDFLVVLIGTSSENPGQMIQTQYGPSLPVRKPDGSQQNAQPFVAWTLNENIQSRGFPFG